MKILPAARILYLCLLPAALLNVDAAARMLVSGQTFQLFDDIAFSEKKEVFFSILLEINIVKNRHEIKTFISAMY